MKKFIFSCLTIFSKADKDNECINYFIFKEDTKYHEINGSDFLRHVRDMHADSDNGFAVEFDDITKSSKGDANGMDIPAEASLRLENKNKNRYVNITACKYAKNLL